VLSPTLISLIELKPYGRCTVKMATASKMTPGILTRETEAPTRTATPTLTSSDIGLSGETTICPYKLAVNPSAV
jgi:hypothetical protein